MKTLDLSNILLDQAAVTFPLVIILDLALSITTLHITLTGRVMQQEMDDKKKFQVSQSLNDGGDTSAPMTKTHQIPRNASD